MNNYQQPPLYQVNCAEESPQPCGAVIFGASGDLAARKLIPSLFTLFQKNFLPENFFLAGFARTEMDDSEFREKIKRKLRKAEAGTEEDIEQFTALCYYFRGDYKDKASYLRLSKGVLELSKKKGTGSNLIFYLAVPPSVYQPIVAFLDESGLLTEDESGNFWRRVVFEKPFGFDLASSRQLDSSLRSSLKENQIYRIDHYLGKETVQNIMMLRFANSMFEPLWNRRYVDHVQITVAEDIGIGSRAGYFDKIGLLRDMFQNHILQILALIAMEPPVSFAADHVRDEKVKLLRSVHPLSQNELSDKVVRGQYKESSVNGEPKLAYREETGVEDNSVTETYTAMKLFIENWRWKGVPFYLRSGKRLARRNTEAAIFFKAVPHSIFHPLEADDLAQNVLRLSIQPREGMALTIQAKRPGPKLCMDVLDLSFNYRDVFEPTPIDAYGRLLLDAMLGDQTLFLRSDNIDVAWQLLEPILADWKNKENSRNPLFLYSAGGQGPEEADRLIENDGRHWLQL